MSAAIYRYVLVDLNNTEGDYEYDTLDDAVADAQAMTEPHAVVERTYTFSDSELVHTPDGSGVWPPKKPKTLGWAKDPAKGGLP